MSIETVIEIDGVATDIGAYSEVPMRGDTIYLDDGRFAKVDGRRWHLTGCTLRCVVRCTHVGDVVGEPE